VTVS